MSLSEDSVEEIQGRRDLLGISEIRDIDSTTLSLVTEVSNTNNSLITLTDQSPVTVTVTEVSNTNNSSITTIPYSLTNQTPVTIIENPNTDNSLVTLIDQSPVTEVSNSSVTNVPYTLTSTEMSTSIQLDDGENEE
ncbi:hypothetical protein GOP47_0025779 [Adiantum capillus-veneris]|uniref:Uncharacterized protein n=1 Tax=Adiantum capillus-veneris TaxID=13818 RepID=A0A9D4U203_ADICA|nr:hypothetical protein GOP47_0025604 [Adiantum capillus-veneris]KAI5059459.1 hypothetical protein GOP47_0025778 [Adiantum capillus-veneris]KAI5059460.1 hypothetical protein GOP47_0025779 [Adiantum capillus-veneris]